MIPSDTPSERNEALLGASGTHGAGIDVSGVRADGPVRHGLGQAGVARRSAGVRGNSDKGRLNFLYAESPVIQRHLMFGSGYPNPYANDSEEASSFKAGTWMPSSIDFGATAGLSGGGTAVATLDGLFTEIQSAGMHSIETLGLIGHGAGGGFGFSGDISVSPEPMVGISEKERITSQSLQSRWRAILFSRDRFAEGAVLTLYSCNSGADQTFLDDLSQAFGVCARGFKSGILWCVASDPAGNIASRGLTKINPGSQATNTGCVDFQQDVRSLTPDAESCIGAPGGGKKAEESQ